MDLTQYERFTWEFFKRHYPYGYEKAHCLNCEEPTENQFTKNDILSVNKCTGCGLVFQNPQPNQALLEQFYDSSMAMSLWADLKKGDLLKQQLKYEQAMAFLAYKNIKNIFDVGCGNGVFLRLLKEVLPDLEASGCELNHKARTICKFHGLDVSSQTLDGALRGVSNKYDAISLWGVLEHLKDPHSAIELCTKALKPGGWLVVCVPNSDSVAVQELKEKCFTFCPQHLWYFNSDTLSKLFAQNHIHMERVYSIEPESVPILKHRAGLDPYDKGVLALSSINAHEVKNLDRDTLLNKRGYKIIAIGEKL